MFFQIAHFCSSAWRSGHWLPPFQWWHVFHLWVIWPFSQPKKCGILQYYSAAKKDWQYPPSFASTMSFWGGFSSQTWYFSLIFRKGKNLKPNWLFSQFSPLCSVVLSLLFGQSDIVTHLWWCSGDTQVSTSTVRYCFVLFSLRDSSLFWCL